MEALLVFPNLSWEVVRSLLLISALILLADLSCVCMEIWAPDLSLLGYLGTASRVGEGTALSGILPPPQTLH